MTAIADLPDIRPSLLLDFANSGRVDPRIECTRASAATCFGPDGKLRVVPANTPRIDYDPATGKCLGLLVEEARTNSFYGLITTNGGTVTSTGATRGISFYALTSNGSMDFGMTRAVSSASIDTEVTQSFYLKKINGITQYRFRLGDSTGLIRYVNIDLNNPSSAGSGVSVIELGGGVVRVGFTYTVRAGNTIARFQIWAVPQDGTFNPDNYVPTGLPFAEIGGLQWEVGAFPTSYIPTEGTAVTRAADYIAMSLPSFTTSTVVASGASIGGYSAAVTNANFRRTWFSLNTSANNDDHLSVFVETPRVGVVRRLEAGAFSVAALATLTSPDGAEVSVSITYSHETLLLSGAANGVAGGESGFTSGGIFNRLSIGSNRGTRAINGYVKRVSVYGRELPNNQLQRLSA